MAFLSKTVKSGGEVLKAANESADTSWSNKFKIALVFGTPVIIGAGLVYYLYISYGKKAPGKDAGTPKSMKKVKGDEPVSTDPFRVAMAFKNSGNKAFKTERYAEAIRLYTEAINCCPSFESMAVSTFYQNRAAGHEMLREYEKAIEDCTSAIGLNRRYVKALQRRAKCYEAIGQINDALNDITAVCILEQFENQANLLMTDRILKQQSKLAAKEQMKTRVPSMPSGHFISQYFESFTKDPLIKCDNANINDEYLTDMVQKLNTEKDSGKINVEEKLLLLQGTIDLLMGNIVDASDKLNSILLIENCDNNVKVNALIKLGTIKVRSGENETNIKESLKYFEDAIKLDPENPDIYIHRSQIFLLLEEINEARKDLETCCKLSDTFSQALAQKLYVQFRCAHKENSKELVNEALSDFQEAASKFPNASEVHSLYAQALMESQDFQKADEHFLKAIECDPRDANLLVHRGILHLQWNNDIERAIQLLELGIEVDNKCQFAFEMLGSIEVQRGDLTKGIECFSNAIAICQTEQDLAHMESLRAAAEAQFKAAMILGIELPPRP